MRTSLAGILCALGVLASGARPLCAAEEGGPGVRLEACREAAAVGILASPRAPAVGEPLRALVAVEGPLDATLVVYGPDGERLGTASERRGGPPYWWSLEASPVRPGSYRIALEDAHGAVACREVSVATAPARASAQGPGTWPVTQAWTRPTEALYGAWIEKLFDDPLDQAPSWTALHEVTRDRVRNLLHDHLGLGEDDPDGLVLVPDCADLPYFLRAYFAWKLGLGFGFSECTRGEGGVPPRCVRWHSNLEPPSAGSGALARMQDFFSRRVAWAVQSGAGRAPAGSDHTDLYPTRLAAETLRPGTVYADPYGHTLVLVRRVPQTPDAGGLLLAVDAQPDGTVARKRYWRGTFLFALDDSLGSAGFKHFRPLVRDGGGLRPLANAEIAAAPDYGDYSLEQYEHGVDGFYDRVDDVLSPAPRDPLHVFRETIDALDEQIRARIRSVANGEAWAAVHRGAVVPMPDGAAIFETTGPWEDYATPARDLRLLIAIDVVRGFPDEVVRRPGRFAMPTGRPPEAVRADLGALLRSEAGARRFEYERSDGSAWTLTLGDVLARAEALEVAYDPNDCVEVRWGAPDASDEMATCTRHAPAAQRARIDGPYRDWFRERRRPPR